MLRAAGLPVGPNGAIDSVHAMLVIGITHPADFYWTLHAVLVSRRDQHEVFDQAFRLFWRDPCLIDRLIAQVLGKTRCTSTMPPPASRRVLEALVPGDPRGTMQPTKEERSLDAKMTWSNREALSRKDFEAMSADEVAEAKAAMARLRLPFAPVVTRRFRSDRVGRFVDLRATLRQAARRGGEAFLLARRDRCWQSPPLIVLCDVSGSMDSYSRMLLHFLHGLARANERVHAFLFGTRITNVTRQLRHRDIDRALDDIGQTVRDWSGGTRIGAAIGEFNRRWARRVLAHNGQVLLITDGLDRDDGAVLSFEMERLRKSCRRLIWLNPLLRFAGFEPKSQGVRAILPHVDEFRPAHNLASLGAVAEALSAPPPVGGTSHRRSARTSGGIRP
jgi:hypothetical protein